MLCQVWTLCDVLKIAHHIGRQWTQLLTQTYAIDMYVETIVLSWKLCCFSWCATQVIS